MRVCYSASVNAVSINDLFHFFISDLWLSRVYKDSWIPSTSNNLVCCQEIGNPFNYFVASINKETKFVGHVPTLVSSAYYLFLLRKGNKVKNTENVGVINLNLGR